MAFLHFFFNLWLDGCGYDLLSDGLVDNASCLSNRLSGYRSAQNTVKQTQNRAKLPVAGNQTLGDGKFGTQVSEQRPRADRDA